MSDHKIEYIPASDLIPYVNNARTHSDEQVIQIASSIQEFGFINPIIIDERNSVIAGHGRLEAAQKLSLDTVPCLRVDHLSEAQRKAYVIADNRIAMNSDWDYEMLKVELEALGDMDFDLDLLGFDENYLDNIMADSSEVDDLAGEWDGMPEYNQEDKTAFRSIIVHFKDQQALDMFTEITCQKITDKTKMIWYPEIEIESEADKEYK